ncbi:MAG TPA: carboxypeptidase-like regulatory domain-containing protein [Pyrinomonadaceae bacterium]|jgi:hypothetical protein
MRKVLRVKAAGALVMFVFVLASLPAPCAEGAPTQGEQQEQGGIAKRLGIRLRSFIPGASASMYFEPTTTGGNVKLLALGLPEPQTLMPGATTYLVWAVASGEQPIRVGELRTDTGGNGGLEFGRPAEFARYSVIVTAEPSTGVLNPEGVMVLASRAGAVTTFFGERQNTVAGARLRRLSNELGRRVRSKRARTDFFTEVDSALGANGGGRTLELFGEEVTPDAHGLARVTSYDRKGYLRAVFTNFALPQVVGANTYIMWSTMPSGRIVYMGSLPKDSELNNTDIYVRVAGILTDDFDLFITAEMRRPVSRPSGRRALTSVSPLDLASQYGAMEGRVVDAEDKPVPGATVSAVALSPAGPGAPAATHADQNGRFFITDLTPGSYMLYAAKEEEGYLSTSLSFFTADPGAVPKAAVAPQQITTDVVLHLGTKAARLVGRVTDAETGESIERAEVTLIRADNPNNTQLTGPNRPGGIFQLIVPALPFRLKISASGYRDWYYGADGTREHWGILRIPPDTTQELTVPMRRVK